MNALHELKKKFGHFNEIEMSVYHMRLTDSRIAEQAAQQLADLKRFIAVTKEYVKVTHEKIIVDGSPTTKQYNAFDDVTRMLREFGDPLDGDTQ